MWQPQRGMISRTIFWSVSCLWGYTRRVLKDHLLFRKRAYQLLLLVAIFLLELKMGQGKQLHFASLPWKKLTKITILFKVWYSQSINFFIHYVHARLLYNDHWDYLVVWLDYDSLTSCNLLYCCLHWDIFWLPLIQPVLIQLWKDDCMFMVCCFHK